MGHSGRHKQPREALGSRRSCVAADDGALIPKNWKEDVSQVRQFTSNAPKQGLGMECFPEGTVKFALNAGELSPCSISMLMTTTAEKMTSIVATSS